MPIELLVPIGLFVLGIVISHMLSDMGARILEQKKR
jgi:hypothetical protein